MTIGGYDFQNLRTVEEVGAVKAELAKAEYSGKTFAEKAAMLADRPPVANPAPAPQIPPSTFNIDHLLSLIPLAEVQKIPADSLHRTGAEIEEGDVKSALRATSIWAANAWISGDTKTALTNACTLVDDPNHPATVPGDSKLKTITGRNIGISAEEVEKSEELG